MIPAILRFETSGGAVQLNLNSATGFQVMAGFHLGDEAGQFSTLSQEPHGEIQVAFTPMIAEMLVPLRFAPGLSWTTKRTLHASLATELKKATNIIRYAPPPGGTEEYLIDTYRSFVPTLFNGFEGEGPSQGGPTVFNVIIRRASEMRGAAAYI